MPFEIFIAPGIICFIVAFFLGIKAYKKDNTNDNDEFN